MKLPLLEGWRGCILQPITPECACPALSSLPRAQHAPKPMFSQRYSPAPLMSPLRSRYYKQPPDEFCQIEGTGTAAQTLIICANRVNLLNNPQQHSWGRLTLPGRVPPGRVCLLLLWGCLQSRADVSWMSPKDELTSRLHPSPGSQEMHGRVRRSCHLARSAWAGTEGQGDRGTGGQGDRGTILSSSKEAPGCSPHPLPSLLSPKPLRAAAVQSTK